jgi:nucleotide-binding universal stress UspA family protein
MFASPKIVLPVDSSEQSIGAAQHAMALACRFHSELHVVHVVDLRAYGIYGLADEETGAAEFVPGWARKAENELDAFLSGDPRNLKVKRILLYGDPADQIVSYAESEKAGLIVLPTHGYGRFRQFLLGSVTTKVLHDAACPVWTGVHLRGFPNTAISFGRILCALNPWDGDYRALAWASEFGKEVGGQVKIVYALPAVYASDSPYLDQETKLPALSAAKEAIAKAQQSAGSQSDVEIVADEPHKGVSDAARKWNADLLVISRGAASGFLGRLRSRTYSIIRESPCPVVSI